MKLVLVDNLVMPEADSLELLDLHPNLGLLSIAAAVTPAGHDVAIYDPKRQVRLGQIPYDQILYKKAAEQILLLQPDAVGFATLGCSFLFAVNVAAILKNQAGDVPILLGGPHATMLHKEILEEFTQFDVVVRYEADETILPVLENLLNRNFGDIPGITWRLQDSPQVAQTPGKPSVANLDTLPALDYELYPIPDLGLKLLRVEAGRGCPFQCTFCSTATFFQRSFRIKSAERLVQELDVLHEKYGIRDFKLDHDLFTVNRHKIHEFCDAVRNRGYRWRASARVDCVNPELLRDMADAGCVELYFGIETGSKRMQKISMKKLNLELVLSTLEYAETLNIRTIASFITGYPEETDQDQNETLDLLGKCFSDNCVPQLHVLTPEPGTALFNQNRQALAYDGYTGPFNAHILTTQDHNIIRDNPEIFSTYFYYPAELPHDRHIFSAQTVDAIRELGAAPLRYILSFYNNRLSVFFASVYQWAQGSSVATTPVSLNLLRDYFLARYGKDHALTSLLRFAVCSLQHASQTDSINSNGEQQGDIFEASASYSVNPRIKVLRGIHDCNQLWQTVTSDKSVSAISAAIAEIKQGDYLVMRHGQQVQTCELDPGVNAVLRLFKLPGVPAELAQLVSHAPQQQYRFTGLVKQLFEKGIIDSHRA